MKKIFKIYTPNQRQYYIQAAKSAKLKFKESSFTGDITIRGTKEELKRII